jgi:hypothetical protein
MKRIVIIVFVAVLGTLALSRVGPVPLLPPDFGTTLPPEPDGAVRSSSVWYCPWVKSGVDFESTFELATAVDVESTITLLHPVPTQEPDVFSFTIRGSGARSVPADVMAQRGDEPGIVEFDDGPAGVTTAAWSDATLTGDRCVVSVPKVWHLVGGTTAEGFDLGLRLFNPFPENAKVTVNAISEFGSAPLPQFEGVDIPARSWFTEDLSRTLPFLDSVTFTISSEQGIVIPMLVLADERDEASWPATGVSATWDFPVVSVPGLEPSLALSNTGSVEATVAIDVFTPSGAILDAAVIIVEPLDPIRIGLSEFAEPPFGIRLRSNAPVGAVVEAAEAGTLPEVGGEQEDEEPPPDATDDSVPGDAASSDGEQTDETNDSAPTYEGLAATVGNIEATTRWLVPGLGVVPGSVTNVWVMNPDVEPATVTIEPLGAPGLETTQIAVAPGSIVDIPVDLVEVTAMTGFQIESSVPVSVSVSIARDSGVAFVAAIAAG